MDRKKQKRITTALLWTVSLCMLFVFAGCTENKVENKPENKPGDTPGISAQSAPISTPDPSKQDDNNPVDAFTTADGIRFTKFDQTASWNKDAVTVTLKENTATVSGDGADNSVSINGAVVTVSKPGTYVLSGTLTNGQIIVDVSKEEKVQLVLNGADITCADSAAIYIKSADKVSLTLAAGTVNQVSDGASYNNPEGSNEPNACIFSKDDLSINGEGALHVKGNYNNGIASKNDLKIISGTISVTALNNGIKGKDSVSVMGGNLTVDVKGDGIKSDNETEDEQGYVYIHNGTITINADEDGIQAVTSVIIRNGTIKVDAGDKQVACKGDKAIDVQFVY